MDTKYTVDECRSGWYRELPNAKWGTFSDWKDQVAGMILTRRVEQCDWILGVRTVWELGNGTESTIC